MGFSINKKRASLAASPDDTPMGAMNTGMQLRIAEDGEGLEYRITDYAAFGRIAELLAMGAILDAIAARTGGDDE